MKTNGKQVTRGRWHRRLFEIEWSRQVSQTWWHLGPNFIESGVSCREIWRRGVQTEMNAPLRVC